MWPDSKYTFAPVAQPEFLQKWGGPKFFEQLSPGAMVELSGSSHNRDVEVFLPR